MVAGRAVTALFIALMALGLSAQQSTEFGRGTGGEIVLTPKGSAPFSGSLELSMSTGSDVFGRDGAPGYGLTAGGTLLQDRLWFFGAYARQEGSALRLGDFELPENATSSSIAARVNTQIAANQDFSAFFERAQRPGLSMTSPTSLDMDIVPSSFLSLRYTGIISSNMFFNASFTRSSRKPQ